MSWNIFCLLIGAFGAEALRLIAEEIALDCRHRKRLARLEANHKANGLAIIREINAPIDAPLGKEESGMKKSELYDLAIRCVVTRWIDGEGCIEDEEALAVLAELFEQRRVALYQEG